MRRNDAIRLWERISRYVRNAAELLAALLYPARCPLCDRLLPVGRRKEVCPLCEKELPWVLQPFCMKCGKGLNDARQEFCEDCRRVRHVYDRGIAAFQYTGKLRGSVGRMKFGNRRDYLDFYAEAMARQGARWIARWQPDAIVPVPMHWHKKNQRGFNQSELLARKISRITGIPARCDLIKKRRDTRNQKELSQKERRKNLSGAFALKKSAAGLGTVLVIDDIYTTGSTADAVAAVLKQGGVEYVYLLVLCTGKR